jgi:hypothetical protein
MPLIDKKELEMNFNKQPSVAAGVFLVVLGLVWWLNLWSLLLPGALLVGGAAAYMQRRQMGRLIEGVQVGIWGVGLALLFMLHFVWPGVLFLAGASFLARGRESRIDAAVQQLVARFNARRASRAVPTQQVQISTHYPAPIVPAQPQQPAGQERSATGDTTRL